MNYRILLGTPTAELEASLNTRFDELAEADVVSAHRSSREVVETVAQLPGLDVVVIHEDLGPLPVLDLIRDLSRNHPQLAVILVVSEITPDTFTGAMEAGARGVVSTEATLEELRARVSNAADWSRTLRRHLEAASLDLPVTGQRGSIVALSGAKGGVGTTTMAVHLAMAAARAKRVVCLVDLDLQTGDLTSFLDLKHRRSIVDLVEAADDISAAMLADTLYVHPDGPHILLSPDQGERGEDVTARAARQVLGSLRSRYELVIVDCGSTMNEATAMAVELADTTLVTLTPDLPAVRGAQRLLAMWERLQIRKPHDVTGVLVRHSRRNEIQPEFARKLLGVPLLKTTIPANYRALEEGENTGDPNRVTDESLRRAFNRTAAELGMLEEPTSAEATEAGDGGDHTNEPALGAVGTPPSGSTSTGPRRSRHSRDDRGAAITEFAALVPLLLLALLTVWQVLLLGITAMYASHAAAEGARQAAVTPDNQERIIEEAKKRVRAPWDDSSTFALTITPHDDAQYVRVSIAMPLVLPGTAGPLDVTGESRIYPEA
ncbi:AAA family ATPase [Salinactinospora qingdaonensis]|uniref:Response regulatory domain-containing protein n=1 Tax=Salinactinospora qingdaonensis TaxID=702744 RepID=A0ABP7EWC6_9ACTN